MAIDWNNCPDFTAHASTFKPRDFVMLRPETHDVHWYQEFIDECGPGPYLILRTHNTHLPGEECNLLGYLDGSPIPMKESKNNPKAKDSWIFGHFFVRNNFLGLASKAIQCHDLQSEP